MLYQFLGIGVALGSLPSSRLVDRFPAQLQTFGFVGSAG